MSLPPLRRWSGSFVSGRSTAILQIMASTTRLRSSMSSKLYNIFTRVLEILCLLKHGKQTVGPQITHEPRYASVRSGHAVARMLGRFRHLEAPEHQPEGEKDDL